MVVSDPRTFWKTFQPGADGVLDAPSRWTACDMYARGHLSPAGSPYHDELLHAAERQTASGLPEVAAAPLHGKFLALQCKLLDAKNALEVGTLGGYGAIWLASSKPDIRVTSVEVNPRYKEVAEGSIAAAGLAERVQVLLGAGMEVLPRLRGEVERGERGRFQLVFIDANKEDNLNYVNEAIGMCDRGACIIVDNIVRSGKVWSAEEAGGDATVAGARTCIEGVGRDPRLDCTMIQTVGEKSYDGFLMCVVK